MSKIQEAWAELARSSYALPKEGADYVQRDARAIALAALEAVVSAVTHDNDMGAFECSDCAWGVEDLRRQIKELK